MYSFFHKSHRQYPGQGIEEPRADPGNTGGDAGIHPGWDIGPEPFAHTFTQTINRD